MRDSESESGTVKVIGGCLVAVIWVVALPYLFVLIAAECGHPDDCEWRPWPLIVLVFFGALTASAVVRSATKYFARKSDGE